MDEPHYASQWEIPNSLSGLLEIFIFSIRGRSNSVGRGKVPKLKSAGVKTESLSPPMLSEPKQTAVQH